MVLAQIQQQMSIDLNSEDADTEDKLRWEEQQRLDPRGRESLYDVPKEIKMRFRSDSIWESMQAGPRREGEVYANAGIEKASRGTETIPSSSPFLGASPVTVLAAITPSPASPIAPLVTIESLQRSPFSSPFLGASPITVLAAITPLPPSPTAPMVTIESPKRSPPPSPPLLLLTAATPPFPPTEQQQRTPTTTTTSIKPPHFSATHTHTNTYIHTHTQTQTQTLTTGKKAEIFLLAPPPLLLHSFHSLPLLLQSFSGLVPILPFLLATFFLALCADRLNVEREIWRAANEVARETVVRWNTEWWGGPGGEWVGWEVGRGMLG